MSGLPAVVCYVSRLMSRGIDRVTFRFYSKIGKYVYTSRMRRGWVTQSLQVTVCANNYGIYYKMWKRLRYISIEFSIGALFERAFFIFLRHLSKRLVK